MTETTTGSLMQTNSSTDTPYTVECYLGSHLNPHVALMTLKQFLEHLAERNDVWAFGFGRDHISSLLLDPAQLTDAVWETIDTVHIFPAMVGGPLPEEEST